MPAGERVTTQPAILAEASVRPPWKMRGRGGVRD